MRTSVSYFCLGLLLIVVSGQRDANADNLFGGKNSIFNNPGQLAGGPNSVVNNPGQITQGAADALNEFQASVLTGPTLERAIIESRNTAINDSMPIPPDIRQMLTGYASEDSMNTVRYKIGDNGLFNLARLLEQGGLATAVTLIDVIVFRGPSEAADPALWAHELTHVDQYAASGTHSFAVQYARQWQRIEDPAYAKERNYQAWSQQRQQGVSQVSGPGFPQQYPPSGMTPQLGAFCYTAVGRFGPGPIQPQGASCWVSLQQGNFQGQIGP